jgi:prepilin-type N-terminal cleavage/methylation domain-containing protein
MHRSRKSARRGFTLVELLVVMVIIGILATFLVIGVMAAMRAAREHRIRVELMGLAGAMETYRSQYDDYPPSNAADLRRHIARLFPRNEDDLGTLVPDTLDQAKILVFCLSGYSPDARHPLTGAGATSLFDFDKKRLINDAGEPADLTVTNFRGYRYIPAGSDSNLPYVYFHKKWDNTNKIYVWDPNQQYTAPGGGGTVSPKTISKDFQIVCAGLGSEYGETNIGSYQDGTEEED